MALTRANLESILIRRTGKRMTFVALDGTTATGANADLNDPIRSALRALGYAVASATAVADADLSPVDSDDEEALIDVAELRTLESILGNCDMVNLRVGQRDEALSDFAASLEKAIARKSADVKARHGIGLTSLTGGAINLDFQEEPE